MNGNRTCDQLITGQTPERAQLQETNWKFVTYFVYYNKLITISHFGCSTYPLLLSMMEITVLRSTRLNILFTHMLLELKLQYYQNKALLSNAFNPKQTMLFGPLRNHGGEESRRSCFCRFLCSPLS